jgi:Xaa-Pro aminopeptidase
VSLVNRDRLAERGRSAGVDIVLASRRDNVRYLADLPDDLATALDLGVAVAARIDPFEIVALLAPRGMAGEIPDRLLAPGTSTWLYGRFYALAPSHAYIQAEEQVASDLLESGRGEGLTFEAALGELITQIPTGTRLAWDSPLIGEVARDLGRLAAVDGAALLREVRQVKTAEEIDRLQRAADVAEAVEQGLFDALAPGVDWAGLAQSVPAAATQRGARFGFMTGGAGWQSGFLYPPRLMDLAVGQLVRLDLGVSVDGYWSDTGRSASIGSPSAETMARYQAIRSGADAALAKIRPGVTFEAVYDEAMAAIRPAIPGYERHHCGHAIGLRAYDGPLVGPGDTTVLEAGMVVNVEVPLYAIGWGGLQLEDTVVVEPDGFRSITRLDRDLFVVPA